MAESETTLKEKTSELETAVDEAQRELARSDATRRSEAHQRLAALAKEASEWLEGRRKSSGEVSPDEAASLTRQAEDLLHEIRMRRTEL